MAKYFNKFKSFIIGPFFAHFPHFGSKKKWKSNSALSGIISNGFLTQCQIFKKLDDPIPIKRLDGQTDIPILIGPFRLSPRVQQYRGRDNLQPETRSLLRPFAYEYKIKSLGDISPREGFSITISKCFRSNPPEVFHKKAIL